MIKNKYLLIIIICIFILLISCGNGNNKIPIIYSDNYNISFYGIENLHSFDTKKYKKVYKHLTKKMKIKKKSFYSAEIASDEDILLIHSNEYIESLNNPGIISGIAEVGILAAVPSKIINKKLLTPMKYGVGGTILGCELALKEGWAINLSGGFHHAKAEEGGGFCFYADVPIAVSKVWQENHNYKILIVDLDAHQGNGYQSIFKDDYRVFMFDIYNKDIYPNDNAAKNYIDFEYPVKSFIEDAEYISLLNNKLSSAVQTSNPDLIIYCAGTDIYKKDKLGRMRISKNGIIRRDEIVFKTAFKNNIPILMVLSGGYGEESADIIGKSIENILKNVIKEY